MGLQIAGTAQIAPALPRATVPLRLRGFTLIEILVVVVIVAILSGVVLANLPSFARSADLDEEAGRLQALLSLARTESQLQAQEMGFGVVADGYEFFAFDDISQQWQRIEQRPLAPRTLPDDVSLSLRIEATDLALPAPNDAASDAERRVPTVLLLSSGETTPFELTLTAAGGDQRTLVADGYAALTWRDDDES